MKNFKKIAFFSFILLPITVILNIYYSIPSKLIVTQNSNYSLQLNYMCSVKSERIEAVSVNNQPLAEVSDNNLKLNTAECGNYNLPVKLFNKIPLKTIAVTVTPQKYVVPSGDTIGVKLYTEGLLIVGISDFASDDGTLVSPAKDAGLEKGDRITAINGNAVNYPEEFSKSLQSGSSPINLTIIRASQTLEIPVSPRCSSDDNKLKLGIWVRDSTAGIGTLTFYDPENSSYAALGHAICDTDTGDIMTIRQGNILTCDILSIVKGVAGTPGELVGSFSDKTLGNISINNELGIYGTINNYSSIDFLEPIGVATRFQIKEGYAEILTDIDGNGVKKYSAEVVKVSKSAKIDNKSMVIKITDPELISKTGGIVQGMSGAPIIQNNLLIGAVTHVFVNDPTKGYGIFAENLLNITNTI